MAQFKVLSASPMHSFKAGQIVTRAPDDSYCFVTFKQLAELVGMDDLEVVKTSAPYAAEDGTVQVLQASEVAAI